MDTAVSPTASQARAAVKYHLELQEEQEEEEKSVCDFQITSTDYKRLALFPGANGVVSFVCFQKENIIVGEENFRKSQFQRIG